MGKLSRTSVFLLCLTCCCSFKQQLLRKPPQQLQAQLNLRTQARREELHPPSEPGRTRQKWKQKFQVNLSPVGHVFSFIVGFLIWERVPYAAYAGDQRLTPNQRIVAEAWRSVDKQFYDRTFNGHDDWFKLRDEFVRKRSYNSKEEVYESVAELLSKLDDPYTRFLTPAKLDSLVNSATSTVGGIGVELLDGTKTGLSLSTASEAANCAVVVGDVQPNSPAEREGLVRGDAFEIVPSLIKKLKARK